MLAIWNVMEADMELTDGIKKIMLAGIGAAAVSYEKSTELLDDLVKKGELTVDQGKTLNKELKHNVEETLKKSKEGTSEKPQDFDKLVAGLSKEDLAKLKAALEKEETKENE